MIRAVWTVAVMGLALCFALAVDYTRECMPVDEVPNLCMGLKLYFGYAR